MTNLRDTGDEQDFDALSEESFDFGHFHELDSDVDEPLVDADRLDPFTAAQREEAASQGRDDVTHSPEADDQFSFTQKLLTNARTLKQLQESGAPEIEIEYENDQSSSSQPSRSQKTATKLQFSDRIDDGSPFVVREKRPSQSNSQPTSFPVPLTQSPKKAQYSFDEASYALLQSELEDTMIQGRFEAFPAGMLREYTYDQVKKILDQTRHYHFASSLESTDFDNVKDDICLSDLCRGTSPEESSPLLHIMSREDEKLVLSDEHPSERTPCTVFAVLPTASTTELESLAPGDCLILSDCYFDHAAQLEEPAATAKTRNVTLTEVEDVYFASQDSFPDHLLQVGDDGPTTITTTTACSILVINAFRSCSSAEWQTHLQHERHRVSSARQMFDVEEQRHESVGGPDARIMTQETAETNYSDGQFEQQLDINDFPVD